ncbi:alpha/beta hydrolase [Georgenia sp. 311]|uniref:Alpha/beta hydrolase n=1 Tax=Georgenia wutianyii TaxID=2585135 RepID=A0ABX5VUD1_9MICO|nr:alpha/beta hydrolase [Georgenia wutianyii]TNC19204.1 alpha/beta hydrolase [Georgenia sp. 311]
MPSAGPAGAWSPPLPEAEGFEHLVVETPGLRTHLAAVGEGRPVLLLHGSPQHWWQWRDVAPALAAHGYRALCPDLRGAGWTSARDPRVDRETRMEDLLALLDALDLDRVDLVSHDMGVVTAMQLSYEHPERVRTAVQLSVPPGFMRFAPQLYRAFSHLPRFVWHRRGAPMDRTFSERYAAHPVPAEVLAAHLAPMARPEVDAAVRPLTRRMVLPEAARMVGGTYRRRRLTVPTLVVFGRRDYGFEEGLVATICRDAGTCADHLEITYVDDAAHFITDDAPAEVAELALDWFARAA